MPYIAGEVIAGVAQSKKPPIDWFICNITCGTGSSPLRPIYTYGLYLYRDMTRRFLDCLGH